MTTFVQRPWVSYMDKLVHSDDQLEQQCKLIRNQIASLDLGFPHFKLYDSHFTREGERRLPKPDSRTLYLEWVADWKRTYRELTQAIRALKRQRSFSGFLAAESEIRAANKKWDNVSRELLWSYNTSRIRRTLEALGKSAQVMLNARYVGKLAAAELRRRRLAVEVTPVQAPVAETV